MRSQVFNSSGQTYQGIKIPRGSATVLGWAGGSEKQARSRSWMVTPTHPAPRQSREGSPLLQKIQVPKRGPRAAQRAQVPPGVPGSPGGPGARAAGVSTNASARMWPFSDTQVRLPPESIAQLAVGVTSQPVAGLDVSLNASEAGSRDVKEVPGNQRCACSSNYIVKCARIVPPPPHTHLLEEDPEVDAGSGRQVPGGRGVGIVNWAWAGPGATWRAPATVDDAVCPAAPRVPSKSCCLC